MKTQRVSDVKLGLDNLGGLWLQSAAAAPRRLDGDFGEALRQHDQLLSARKVCVLAVEDNVELIHHLAQLRRREGRPARIMLGPPSAMSTANLGHYSENLASSLGGWRELSPADEITYALASALKQHPEVTVDVMRLATRHPAWPALSFPSGFHAAAAVQLIVAMKDPRWHVDEDRPSSSRRLASFFGVGDNEGGARNLTEAQRSEAAATSRLTKTSLTRVLLATWGGMSGPPRPQNKRTPRDFLWRIYDDVGEASTNATLSRLRVCRVFLKFVRDVWLDNLTPPREYALVKRVLGKKQPESVSYVALQPPKPMTYSRQLFVPHHFFGSTEEIGAWERHIKAWRQQTSEAV